MTAIAKMASMILDLDKTDVRLPRYQRLRDAIVARIAGGEWSAGDLIPSETEIARTSGVAVGTVRKAVDMLVAEGILDRAQGRGTSVRRPSLDRSFFRFFRAGTVSFTDAVPEGRILSRKIARCPKEACAALGIEAGASALRLDRLRLLNGRPLLVEEIWLDPERFELLRVIAPSGFGDLLYPLYERLCGEVVAFAEETLTIDVAGKRDVAMLKMTKGSPIVVIERVARGYDRHPIEWRRSRGAGNLFSYRIDIR